MLVGAQFFTVRNYLTSEEKIEQAFKKSKELGYQCVQYSGAPDGGNFNADFLKKIIDKYALPVTLTHISYDRLKNNLKEEIEKHKKIGCENIGLGMMPIEFMKDEQSLNHFIKEVGAINDSIEDAGLHFYYHNHNTEFQKLENGVTIFDYLYEKMPKMNFTLDLHWLQRGGVSVLEYIQKCKGRTQCVHLKDYKVIGYDAKFAPIGSGNFNWKDIFSKLQSCGVKYAFVEQDDAPDLGEPFDCLKQSAEYMKKEGFLKNA